MSGSHPGRPRPTGCPSGRSRCSPTPPARPRSPARHPTARPPRRWRLRQPGRPRPSAPSPSASPLAPRCQSQDRAALVRRGVEDGHATGLVGGWDLGRVDEGVAVGGVWKVIHAVVAHALGEPEGRRLLLRAPLSTQGARWLQVLARIDGLRPHRGAHTDPIDELALRVRVWEVGDTVPPHALGELHRLVLIGGVLATAGAGPAAGAGTAGGAGVAGRCGGAGAAAAAGATTARADHGDDGDHGKGGQRPECATHGFSPRVLIASTPVLCRACIRGGVPGAGVGCGESGIARWPLVWSTVVSAAARAAARLGWPGTRPVMVVRLPWVGRMARKAKQPPAAAVEPVLTPTNPFCPSSVLVLCRVPATGRVALGVAAMLANTGRRMARSTMRTWSAAVETVASS